ncbi:hypothetical protein LCGC14_0851600 [marine sediment metagenome]|uniref:Uncharacterized protein n=1 Tax=marine sediment metagenome TaxID=412755 RepID=A0A0F9PVD0_9ZZZZ
MNENNKIRIALNIHNIIYKRKNHTSKMYGIQLKQK